MIHIRTVNLVKSAIGGNHVIGRRISLPVKLNDEVVKSQNYNFPVIRRKPVSVPPPASPSKEVRAGQGI